jgi:very-short-patch-repair endonuclease
LVLHQFISSKILHPYKLTTYFYEGKERNLFVDFYFEYKNKKVVVEYQGEQHYRPVTFNGISESVANRNFQRQLIRDETVRDYCKKNSVVLIEVDGREYNIYKDNIKNYLEIKLKEII